MAADIVTFDASRRRIHRKGATGAAGEILLFSGVRYERAIEPIAAVAEPFQAPEDAGSRGKPGDAN